MNDPVKATPTPDLREILAAERTFLAWIRTGLALMGFGFVVARFGIFLREVQVARVVPSALAYGESIWFGTALISLGVIVNLLAAWKHIELAQRLNRGEMVPSRPSKLAVFIALLLALVGIAMGIYLVSSRGFPEFQGGRSVSALQEPTTSYGRDIHVFAAIAN